MFYKYFMHPEIFNVIVQNALGVGTMLKKL